MGEEIEEQPPTATGGGDHEKEKHDMSTTTYSTTDRAEKVQRLRTRLTVALGRAVTWEALTDRERLDLDGELDYLEDNFRILGLDADADEVEGIHEVLHVKARAFRRAYDLNLILGTMAHLTRDHDLTAADLLPYAWQVLEEHVEVNGDR